MAIISLDSRFFPEDLRQRAHEYRKAAHKALQDLQQGKGEAAHWGGWYDYPKRVGFSLVRDIQTFKDKLSTHYDLVLVIGIGGSYLGTRAVADALNHTYLGLVDPKVSGNRPMLVYAGHTLTENHLIELIDLLERKQPIVNVISKSGTTTEPSIAFRVVRNYMEKRFGSEEARRRIVVTTDKNSGALRKMSTEHKYESFIVPDDIGGRYSVLTSVGLVPLALAGINIEKLMEGADAEFSSLDKADPEHPALRYAALRQAAMDVGKSVDVMVFSDPKLFHFVEWWKQLFGESQGKDGKGMFPAGLSSTTDLHSLGQFEQEGARTMIETFLNFQSTRSTFGHDVERQLKIPHAADNSDQLGYLEGRLVDEVNQTAMLGTKVAHYDGQVPCLEIRAGALNEFTLGQLFAFFETSCAVGGALLGVNPFDQPGVEAYKKNLFALLGKPGTEDLGAALRKRIVETGRG